MVNLSKKSSFFVIKNNIKREVFEGVGMTAILGLIAVIMIANIVRVINNGISNYNIYIYEKDLLQKALDKNEDLKREYEYYRSDEAKMLLARDVLSLGDSNDNLYTIKEETQFFEVEKKLLDVDSNKEKKQWWKSLLEL